MSDSDMYQGGSRTSATERRSSDNRRVRPDPRNGIRFDTAGGDRRSGFARRQDDDGLRDADFED